jgi:peptidoglycan hydrolase-like protein with peptidoglycan-binding domain
VLELQKRLTTEGLYSGPITGYFGVLTQAAVKAFQKKNNLETVGTVGLLTQSKLNAPTETKATQAVLGASLVRFDKTLRGGSTGDDVLELQKRLTTEGLYSGPITGYFGVLTEIAVKAFQKKNNLEAVGSLGPKTRALLNRN